MIKVDKKLKPNPYYAALLYQLKSNISTSSSSSKTAVAVASSITSLGNMSATAGSSSTGGKRKAANSGTANGDVMNTQAIADTYDLSTSADSNDDDDSTNKYATTTKVARV
jgi:hypothetical protein